MFAFFTFHKQEPENIIQTGLKHTFSVDWNMFFSETNAKLHAIIAEHLVSVYKTLFEYHSSKVLYQLLYGV